MAGGTLQSGSRRAGPVLIVEDDADVRQALADLLQEEGYECILAKHGVEAIECLRGQMPSLLLVDLVMPVMDGVDLIARLRCDARWSELPIVVMTAAGDRIMGVDVESLNVPVLRKPVDIATLVQVLARHSRVSAEIADGI